MQTNLDKRLKALPRPTLGEGKKNDIHSQLMMARESGNGGSMMKKFKPVMMMAASIAAIAVFLLVLMVPRVVENTNMSGDGPKKNPENYVEFLKNIEVHGQIDPAKAFIGNNGALITFHGNILPGSYYADGMELQTNEDPMGINMKYRVEEDNSAEGFDREVFSEENLPYTILFNATVYFTFFTNGEWVTFHIDNEGEKQTYTVTRDRIEELYGKDVNEYQTDQEAWNQEVIENVFNQPGKVSSFFRLISTE